MATPSLSPLAMISSRITNRATSTQKWCSCGKGMSAEGKKKTQVWLTVTICCAHWREKREEKSREYTLRHLCWTNTSKSESASVISVNPLQSCAYMVFESAHHDSSSLAIVIWGTYHLYIVRYSGLAIAYSLIRCLPSCDYSCSYSSEYSLWLLAMWCVTMLVH